MIAAVTDRHFQRLCGVLALDDVRSDVRFEDATGRVKHRDEITRRLADVLIGDSCEYWCRVIGAAGIPVSPVNSLPDALASAVTAERGLLAAAGDDASVPLLRTPIDDGSCLLRRPPTLGQHTDEVIAEFGATAD